MKWILQLPVIRELHARRLLFPVLLGLTVIGVLLSGAFNRGPGRPAGPQLDIQLPPIDAPALRPDLEKTPFTYLSDYWLQLGQKIENKLVLIAPDQDPGVVVAPGVALTSIHAAHVALVGPRPAGRGETAKGTQLPPATVLPQRLLGINVELGLALFAIKQPPTIGTFSYVNLSKLLPGSYVAAVSLAANRRVRITPGNVVSLSPSSPPEPRGTHLEVAIPFPTSYETAAIVNLDGHLVGVAVPGKKGMVIYSVDQIPRIVERLAQGQACQAIEVGAISDPARKLLGLRGGVVVERVRVEAFSPEPSIHEGDILLSWNSHPLTGVEQFDKLYSELPAGTLVRYQALRNRRRVSGATRMPGVDCRPAPRPAHVYSRLGLTLQWEDNGWRVNRVEAGGPAAAAGIEVADLIVGIGGRQTTERDQSLFRRLDNKPRPVALTVRRGSRVEILAVTPQADTSPARAPHGSGSK